MGIFGNITTPYRPLESWFYDRYISPALAGWTPMLLQQIEQFMSELPPNATILDVGCGGGQLVIQMANTYPQMRFTGLDQSKEQIARARQRADRFGERTRFVESSATALPFPNDSYDLVVSVGSLKHWPDRKKGLVQCVRVLRPGCGLMVCDAVRDTPKEEFEKMATSLPLPGVVRSILKIVAAKSMMEQSPSAAEVKGWLEGLAVHDVDIRQLAGIPGVVALARKRRMDG